MGHLPSLSGLLKTQANIHKPLPRQKCANLLAALDSLYLLLAPLFQQQTGNQVCWPAFIQMLVLTGRLHSLLLCISVPDIVLLPETYNWYHSVRTDAFMNGKGLSFFMGPRVSRLLQSACRTSQQVSSSYSSQTKLARRSLF